MPTALELARETFVRRAWTEALDGFARAEGLDRADHERMAVAAYLVGADEPCERAWEAAYHAALEDDDAPEAARCAFWLGLCLLLRGQMARAGGWLARTESLVADRTESPVAAQGYLLIPALLQALDGGNPARARELAEGAIAIGRAVGDADLSAFAVLGLGQALLASGDVVGGTARLDEVMVSVTSGEVGPVTSGIVYCAVVLECMALLDLARAAEWTQALGEWCDAQPDLVPYRGQCLVHRSQLQVAGGQWSDAVATADAARRRLEDPPHPALGLAYYQEGEIHRLLGDHDAAEVAYRHASRHGRDPVPGLALLELARGETASAVNTIRRALHEARDPGLLAAAVDVFRAAGDIEAAREVADELADRAGRAPSAVLSALASQASGAVLVAEGDPVAALAELRAAARAWQALRMPYEAARTSVVIALACAALGDRAAAELELANARATFTELEARPDLEGLDRLDALGAVPEPEALGGLSRRERQVLSLVASGRTNREIAAELHISQHTVGRHVENVFTKLGVTNRAGATARAYELGLITR
jgi:DNA-binding NarL/FixJ family response regulator